EDLQARSGARLDGRLHGLRIGMHGQEGRAEPGDALDTTRDRVADIVQLEIDEDLLALVGELADQRQAAGIAELIADLVEAHAVAEPRHHGFRLRHIGQVERHDQAVFVGDARWLHGYLTSCAGRRRSAASPAPSGPRYRPLSAVCPYRHRPDRQRKAPVDWAPP